MLLGHWRGTLVLCACSGPFWVVAMILSGIGWSAMLLSAGYVLLWVITLRLVRMNLKTPAAQLHACTAANALLGVGPLIWYIRSESGLDAGRLFWSPLTAGLSLPANPSQVIPFIIPLVIGLLAGLSFWFLKRVTKD